MKLKAWIVGVMAAVVLWPRRSAAEPGRDNSSEGNAAVMTITFLGRVDLPRGIRNNNPGNIEINAGNRWRGKVPIDYNTDGRFEQFESFVYGVRAMIVLIRNYILRGDNTIQKILNRYAPSSENNTEAYISAVSSATGFGRNQELQAEYRYIKPLVMAMAEHETGWPHGWIDDNIFDAAWTIV